MQTLQISKLLDWEVCNYFISLSSSLSISLFKLTSVEEVEEVDFSGGSNHSGSLMPSANIRSNSRDEDNSANVDGFEDWREKDTQRYRVVTAQSQSPSKCAFIFIFYFFAYSFVPNRQHEVDRGRSVSPMSWTPR